ncbi:MAG: hypothetical protein L6R41_003529 [Letrouitia leprolyta]|nr:MAG: hypothetical protein L6R41_003529 [Letrouitia leprolyta]
MRIAVDASIWHFQTQAGQGGSNPALRTLYYRLIRLLSLSIKPLFVFDGRNKPPFKRNVKTGSLGAQLPSFITKQLLDLFGFPYHTAPGEAEAECALLQREGIVDAVLSEDVDTIMFGCTVHLRNWSSENTRGNKSPTHVNMYRAEVTREGKSGLDRDGMILVALMSGGDYIPAGVPGCGVKTACEAARAGFGQDLCQLSIKDTVGFNQWRERLQYELAVNESAYFRTKHKALVIPEDFPDKKVLRYYTHPAVSNAEQLSRLRERISWDRSIDLYNLRQFVAEAFEWQRITGAKKFLRTLGPAMLIDSLCRRYCQDYADDDRKTQEADESSMVMLICGRRNHWATDGISELRIAYTPADSVAFDLDAEEPDIEVTSVSDSENEVQIDDVRDRSRSPTKRHNSTYDPGQPEKIWVPESYVKFGIPLMVENWEEAMKDPKRFASRKAREGATVGKKSRKPEFMKPGAMDAFVKVAKPGIDRSKPEKSSELLQKLSSSSAAAKCLSQVKRDISDKAIRRTQSIGRSAPTTPKKSIPRGGSRRPLARTPSITKDTNPWTLAKRPPETMNVKLAPGTRFSALGIYEPSSSENSPKCTIQRDKDVILISSPSPKPPSDSLCRRRSIPQINEEEHLSDLTTQRVNRRLDFTEKDSPVWDERPPMLDPLPSPSGLLFNPVRGQLGNTCTKDSMLSKPQQPTDKNTKRARALLALRESLNGTWRDINPWEQDKSYVKTKFEGVEVVDLTKT